MTIDEYMALPWHADVQPESAGGVVLTVRPLDDFAVYGATEAEVRSQWTDALRSHLEGYLHVGKAIPTSTAMLSANTEEGFDAPDR